MTEGGRAALRPEEFSSLFPTLTRIKEWCWRGVYRLHASFDSVEIDDEFDIEVEATDLDADWLPLLREIGGRTETIAAKHAVMDLRTLHRNPKGQTACLCVRQEERIRFPAGSSLSSFMDGLVMPYLYGLAYYDRHGKWPWQEFSHGVLGMLEYAAVVDEMTDEFLVSLAQQPKEEGSFEVAKQLRALSPNRRCPCGSSRAFRRCHAEAWNGIKRIHREAHLLGVDLKALMPRPA